MRFALAFILLVLLLENSLFAQEQLEKQLPELLKGNFADKNDVPIKGAKFHSFEIGKGRRDYMQLSNADLSNAAFVCGDLFSKSSSRLIDDLEFHPIAQGCRWAQLGSPVASGILATEPRWSDR